MRIRIPTRRTNIHRDKFVDVEASKSVGVEIVKLGQPRATYAVRIPIWLGKLLWQWERRRIEEAETRVEDAITVRVS